MHNDWFQIGPFTVHGYGVMMAVGILSAIALAERLSKKHGLEYKKIDNFAFVTIISGFLCAKLLYVLTVLPQFFQNPLSVLGGGGWVVYGAIIGGLLGAYWYCKKHGWDYVKVLNIIIVTLPLAQAIGRIGCYFAGCCYGIETDAWYGVLFPKESLCPTGHKVIPTQILMAIGDYIIFVILYYRLEKLKKIDKNVAVYLILYSAGRFFMEFIRGDRARGFVGVLSTSQFVGIFAFLFGLILYFRKSKNDFTKSTKI